MHPDRTLGREVAGRVELIYREISSAIIGVFYQVYNDLGFGFLESVYTRAVEILLRERGFDVQREYPIAITVSGQQIGFHRCDMVVNRVIIVEIKATECVTLARSSRDCAIRSPRAWRAETLLA